MSPHEPSERRRDERLRPFERLHTSGEFRRVFEEGRRFRTEPMRIQWLPTSREYSRLGLVVSRRHGRSVVRSRTKRLLRTCFRLHKHELPGSFDVILLPNGAPRSLEVYREAFRELVAFLRSRSDGAPEAR